MAPLNGVIPKTDGLRFNPYYIQAAANENAGTLNFIPFNRKVIVVSGVTVDSNDYIVLPPLNTVPVGHEITILAQAGSDFELRTYAGSNEKINDTDSDGSNNYKIVDTHSITVVKMDNTAGWMAIELTKLGATVTAVVPNATSASSSASHSPSASLSPSSSASVSRSPSASLSPSSSASLSQSPSSSSSASQSPSASRSPSASLSPSSSASSSASASLSPSSSASSSASASLSPSASESRSLSPSSSKSPSPSISPSASMSPSASPSN